MSKLMMDKLQEYTGHHISVMVDGGEVFTGQLLTFDGDVLVLNDIVDSRGNKGKELLVSMSNVLWVIRED
jgi:small nuclear ribonucleoprotein (snRNP)-like protein